MTQPNTRGPLTYRSRFGGGVTVTVDPWGDNPLVDELREASPLVFKAASATGPAPTLFNTGDLPPFTASDVNPLILKLVNWRMRHGLAAEPDRRVVLGIIEDFGNDPDHGIDVPPLDEYIARVNAWAVGGSTPTDEMSAAQLQDAEDAMYENMFGADDRRMAYRRLEQNAIWDAAAKRRPGN